ncbi:hypothetical protein LJB42_003544 [Komagataella kurtzmanii]|nr:hypothetical protein LJB42_003544 [Komagataella kurtzmanii]
MSLVALHQFDYIFAIAMMFAFLDAFNIGANDVANSFSSSVSSRCLKYWQAMILAAIMEFLGAVLAGARVTDTIRKRIINVHAFDDDPAMLMLTMATALVGSSVWLSIATYVRAPVSTTHSIVGGVIGAGIAAKGAGEIHWGWSGFAKIVASWFIAPCVAGGFASILFLFCKFTILERKHDARNALLFAPCIVFLTFAVLTMLIVWKGAPNLNLDDLNTATTVGSIFGVAAVGTTIYVLFFFPFLKRRIIDEDWTLKWYQVFYGIRYWFMSKDSIPPKPDNYDFFIDYYEGRRYEGGEQDSAIVADAKEEATIGELKLSDNSTSNSNADENRLVHESKLEPKEDTTTKWSKLVKSPKQWPYLAWLIISHGWTQDVIASQKNGGRLAGDLQGMHGRAKYYSNKVEHIFSLFQAFTACTMSFAHGSNDISNAAGPLSTVWVVYTTNDVVAEPPIWILCYTAAALVLGVWIFGYRLMANLGNKLTLQSPSRGFAIELGAAITTVFATQLEIPISTTQCAVGATVFVGLCNKDVRAVNWRMVAWCYLGWLFTLPCAGLISGIIMGIIINAPQWGVQYELTS